MKDMDSEVGSIEMHNHETNETTKPTALTVRPSHRHTARRKLTVRMAVYVETVWCRQRKHNTDKRCCCTREQATWLPKEINTMAVRV